MWLFFLVWDGNAMLHGLFLLCDDISCCPVKRGNKFRAPFFYISSFLHSVGLNLLFLEFQMDFQKACRPTWFAWNIWKELHIEKRLNKERSAWWQEEARGNMFGKKIILAGFPITPELFTMTFIDKFTFCIRQHIWVIA